MHIHHRMVRQDSYRRWHMCTRRRQEFCGSAVLWPSIRPKPTVFGETTCSRSSHVGRRRLTWTFAGALCQGLGAKEAPESTGSFWGGPYLAIKKAKKLSDAELQAQALKLPARLRDLAEAACQHKPKKCKPDEYFKQWRSQARCAKGASKERWRLLQSVGKAKAHRKQYSANLLRPAMDCLNRAHRFGAPEKVNAWLSKGGRKRRATQTILQPSGHVTKAQKKVGGLLTFRGKKNSRR